MRGISLTFKKNIQTATDEMNNPVNTQVDMVVDNCLVAPMTEPANAHEEQAMSQRRLQVRIHLPKTFDADVSDSDVIYAGKLFHIDSDSVALMADNTPTQWNRYFTAELVNNFVSLGNYLRDGFLLEDGSGYFASENSYYYFAQELVS